MTVTPDETARAARAGEALVARHAGLREVLDHWAGVLAAAAGTGGPVRPVRNLLRAFLADEVLPHARAEERTLYRAARRDPGAGLLVQALTAAGQVAAGGMRAERAQARWRQVPAVLLHDSPERVHVRCHRRPWSPWCGRGGRHPAGRAGG